MIQQTHTLESTHIRSDNVGRWFTKESTPEHQLDCYCNLTGIGTEGLTTFLRHHNLVYAPQYDPYIGNLATIYLQTDAPTQTTSAYWFVDCCSAQSQYVQLLAVSTLPVITEISQAEIREAAKRYKALMAEIKKDMSRYSTFAHD